VTHAPRFAHASEAELARILDYYGVAWEYEPRTFPILWNTDGKVVESFSPDFYLPEMDVYVELTTLKQSLVRRKNRKLRRLRELYPDIKVKLFYGKDFRALMLKYGRFDLAASLSGLEGQLMPDRPAATVQPEAVTQPSRSGRERGPDSLPGPDVAPAAEPEPARAEARRVVAGKKLTRLPMLKRRGSRGSRRRRGRRAFIASAVAAGDES
jgi:hypoxanthine phosphoribosyltransferase